jgi:tRNA (guanine10-N2)-dimethyltransferase
MLKNEKVNLFFLFSGEHSTLPFSELKSILEAEGHIYRVLERQTQVMRVETNAKSVWSVEHRAALTRACGVELFSCYANPSDILDSMRNTFVEGFIERGDSFVVRLRRVRGSAPHISRLNLERKLGELILDKVKGVKVNLKKPKKTFLGILTGNRFVFGLRLCEISPKSFIDRRPRNKPFFHPSAIPAKLARCMVNLAQPKSGDLLLDPFCGTGSILIEAGLIGCRVIGLDVKRHMIEGSFRNLLRYNVIPEGMTVADAKCLPFSKTDCIVTDPPYGRSATTLGRGTHLIVQDILSTVKNVLSKGRRTCIAAPKTIRISDIGRELNLKHVESHFIYVHSSLTREVAVFELM